MKKEPWSAVARVPTANGDLWFKENPPQSAYEPALTELLWRRRPDAIPEVVATTGPRMLTRDVGARLRAVHDAGTAEPRWETVFALYAELQVELAAEVHTALDLGTPDARPETFAATAARLGADEGLVRVVAAAADRLDDTVPLSVVHMEAHDGNVFVRSGAPIFIDWAEAVVTHPFVGLLLPLRFAAERLRYAPGSGDVDRLRDAYLEGFTRFAPLDELRQAFAAAYLLAPVCRAQMWDELLAPLGPAAVAAHGDPATAWLEILREVVDGTTTLGGA